MMQYVETQGAQGICPAGWHLPTNSQFTSLASYLGGNGNAGGRMKSTGTLEAGTGLWHDPNEEATNSSGFSAIPGGLLNSAEFFQIGYEVNWWSSNVYYGRAWYQTINYLQGFLIPNFGSKNNGYSVRCLRD